MRGSQRFALYLWGAFIVLSSAALIAWVVVSFIGSPAAILAAVLILLIEGVRIVQASTLWIFARMAEDPVPLLPVPGMRVAVHTTIVPSKEPFELVASTLLAMKRMRYDGTVDVWLLDEGDDPAIREWCRANGINHFSRKGVERWNTPDGQFKARTKHGNLNSFHDAFGENYDVVAQMDPDHVPSPDFLERTLGYFNDPDVGFVVAPQVYGNHEESFIARASAFQAYVFHGVIQRGGNGLRAPLLIGTNHLVRTSALRAVGGYADSIIEDHLTSMVLFVSRATRKKYWKGVYTPDVISIGEGPTSFTDYFNQQKRWAYGVWEIAGKYTPRMIWGMKPGQRITFLMLQFFYPSVAINWFLSVGLSAVFIFTDVAGRDIVEWAVLWGASMVGTLGFFLWLRRFNLVEHERRDWGLGGMALLLMCIPVYVSAGVQAVLARPLTYAVTAKGKLASPDGIRTFAPHLVWIGILATMLAVSFFTDTFVGSQLWMVWMLLVCVAPIVIFLRMRNTEPVEPDERVGGPVPAELVGAAAGLPRPGPAASVSPHPAAEHVPANGMQPVGYAAHPHDRKPDGMRAIL